MFAILKNILYVLWTIVPKPSFTKVWPRFFPFFFVKCIFYISPSRKKSLGSKTYFIPLKKAVTFGDVVAVHELRRQCTDLRDVGGYMATQWRLYVKCVVTSICAWSSQFVHSNYNSKSNGLFQGDKINFRTRTFFSSQGI